MNEHRLLSVLQAPHVSEKAASGAEAGRQYVFKVALDATRHEVKAAVEALFDVKVNGVRTLRQKGKTTNFGRIKGKRSDWKKAYVTLAEGSEIEMAEA